MVGLQEVMDFLRVDGEDNERVLSEILKSIPPYIEVATGMDPVEQDNEPMADQAVKFIASLWYNPEQQDAAKVTAVIESLLKAMKAKKGVGGNA